MTAWPRQFLTCLSAIVWCVAVAQPASGQDVAATFENVRNVVKRGDTVYVADANGRETKGTVGSLSASSLELVGRGTFVETDVNRIRVERNDPVWRGMLIGLAAAGIPWLLVCASDDAWCEYGEYGAENVYRVMAVTTTVIGASVGALIDWSIKEKVVVYRAPAQRSLTLGVFPLVAPSRVGVQLSARF